MLISLVFFLAAITHGIDVGGTYDCGPGYVSFRVLQCSGGICDVSYQNPGQAARRTRMYESAIRTAISRGCHVNSVKYYQNQAAAEEARANALLAGNAPARVAVRPSRALTHVRSASGSGLVLGKYECYILSGGALEATLAVNFTLFPGGRFTDYENNSGTYSYANGWVTLHGTGLNGQRLRYTAGVVHSNHPPNLTYVRNGEDRESCDGEG